MLRPANVKRVWTPPGSLCGALACAAASTAEPAAAHHDAGRALRAARPSRSPSRRRGLTLRLHRATSGAAPLVSDRARGSARRPRAALTALADGSLVGALAKELPPPCAAPARDHRRARRRARCARRATCPLAAAAAAPARGSPRGILRLDSSSSCLVDPQHRHRADRRRSPSRAACPERGPPRAATGVTATSAPRRSGRRTGSPCRTRRPRRARRDRGRGPRRRSTATPPKV